MPDDVLERLKTALADRYRIERELGRGGMATVHLAEDLKHHRRVAIKVLRPELSATIGVERFLREIEIAANLTHPHILPLHDSGEAGGFLFYVMPYIDGESLRDRLLRERQLPIVDALTLTKEVASALSYAHDQGVIHRDIKPENIMLSAGGAVVADFGIARAVSVAGGEQLTETGMAVGTPAYMSPEQAMAEEVDSRSDIYSLACVVYEMMGGDPPYTGSTPKAVLARKLTDPVPSLAALRSVVSGELEAVVVKALAREPVDRFATAAEFTAALENPTVLAPEDTRKHRLFLASAVVLVVAAAAVVAGRTLLRMSEPQATLERSSIIVAPIVNETGDAAFDQLVSYTAHQIAYALQRMPGQRVISPDLVQQYQLSLPTPDASQLGQRFGAGTIVSGRLYGFLTADSLQFQITVTDAANNQQLGQTTVAVPRSNAEQYVEPLQERVLTILGVALDPAFGNLTGTEPVSLRAFELLREARHVHISEPSQSNNLRAAQLALEAYQADTTFVAALYWAVMLGVQLPAFDSLLSELDARVERLPRAYHLMHQSNQAFNAESDLEKAYDLARRAFDADPSFGNAANNRMFFAMLTNRPHDALETALFTFEMFQSDEVRGWFPFWVFRCGAHHMLGQHEEELRVAQGANSWFPLELHVVVLEGRALAALSRVDDVLRFLDEHGTMGPGLGGALGTGWLRYEVGRELLAHGNPGVGREVLSDAAAWFQERASDAANAIDYHWSRASALYAAGNLAGAAAVIDSLAAEFPDSIRIGGQEMTPALRGYQGLIAARRGERETAMQVDAQLALRGSPEVSGLHTWFRAKIAAVLGDKEQAVRLLHQAHGEGNRGSVGGSFFFEIHLDPDLTTLRDYPSFQELMRSKG